MLQSFFGQTFPINLNMIFQSLFRCSARVGTSASFSKVCGSRVDAGALADSGAKLRYLRVNKYVENGEENLNIDEEQRSDARENLWVACGCSLVDTADTILGDDRPQLGE